MNVELHYKGDSNRDEEYVMNKTEWRIINITKILEKFKN
jgi:hypothetical protein